MAEVSTVPPNHIDVQLFSELKHRFPEVPDNVVTDVMKQHLNIRERCIEALGRESNKYLYGEFTSGGLPVEANHHPNHLNPANQSNLNQVTTKIAQIHISTSQAGTDRQRSHSGGSSGSHDFRQRSDSSESRTSLTSIGSNHSAGPGFNKVGAPPGPTTTPGDSELQAARGQQYLMHTTPHFTSVHQAFVEPGSQSASVLQQNYDPFLGNSQQGGVPGQYPPQHSIYTPTTTQIGTSQQKAQRTASVPGHLHSQIPGSAYGPYEPPKGVAGYNPVQSYSGASQPPRTAPPVYSSTGYPLQQPQSGPPTGQFIPQGWGYNSPDGSSHVTPATRPAQFPQSFPAGSYTQGNNTPSPQHHYPPSDYSSPKRDMQPNAHVSYTPPRPGYSGQTAGPRTESPVSSRPGMYPPVSSPSQSMQGPYMTHFQIRLGSHSGGISARTPSPGNPPGGFYLPGSQAPSTPGSGSESGTPTHGYPQQVFYPGYQPWTTPPSASATQVQNPLMSPSPDMARIMQQPMQPILSPASSHSSLSGAETLHNAGPIMFGDGRSSRSGSIPGTEDIAYTQALILHQRARLEKLLKDSDEARKKLVLTRSEVQDRERMFLEWRKQKASSFPSALDVQKMREENRRLQIDIQLMTREIDMVNNGQTPLGVVDPGELQSFYNNIGTGQRGSIHASPPISSSSQPTSGRTSVIQTSSTSSTTSSSTGIGSRQPPPRPPPPSTAPHATSPSSHPATPPHLVGMVYPPVPVPREQPPPYSEQPPEQEEGDNWSCSACSFLNHPALDHCELCEMPRINVGCR